MIGTGGQSRRIGTSFLISVVLNVPLLVIDFSIDPRQSTLSTVEKTVLHLLTPAETLTMWLVPSGHGGGQILSMALFSVLLCAVLAWIVLSLPVWWRNRV